MTRISKAPYERRKEILDTALELFLKNGYENTSIGDIVAKLGVAQGLFYYYFKSKEEVYRAALEQYTDEFAAKLQTIILDSSIPMVRRIEAVLKTMSDIFAESEHALMDELHRAEHIDMDQRLSMHVAQMLVEPVTGMLDEFNGRGITKIENPGFTATFLIFGIYGLVHGNHEGINSSNYLKINEITALVSRVLDISPETMMRI
jgi:AcrR family transcriptional regulator